MIKVGPVYAFSWLCQSYAQTFFSYFFFSTASKRRRAPWPVARGPGATPSARPRANLSHAAVTRYISAGFAVAWRV